MISHLKGPSTHGDMLRGNGLGGSEGREVKGSLLLKNGP